MWWLRPRTSWRSAQVADGQHAFVSPSSRCLTALLGTLRAFKRGTVIIGVRTSLPQAAVRVNRSGTRILQIALLLRAMARWHRSDGGGLCLTHWVPAAAGRGGVRLGNHDRRSEQS